MIKIFFGEVLGTTLLVGLGCYGIVASFAHGIPLYGVALHWGAAVALAIIAFHKLSGVHLNPAVSLAFLVLKKCTLRQFIFMIVGQYIGAIIGGAIVYLLVSQTLGGLTGDTSRILAESFPNEVVELATWKAYFYEATGTFLLVGTVLIVASMKGNPWLAAIVVPVVLVLLIIWIAPFTQAGLNPARDIGPRLVAYFTAWPADSFRNGIHVLGVYTIGPCVGSLVAVLVYRAVQRIFQSSVHNENIRKA